MAVRKKYTLPADQYDIDFIKALACVIHLGKLEPAELEFWFDTGWTQFKMATEMKRRLK